MSGVGNWVADEVLFQAGIHPEAACDTLSEGQISRLHAALLSVVNVAVAARAESSAFPDDWLFHPMGQGEERDQGSGCARRADHLHHGRWAYVSGRRLTAAQGREGEGDEQQARSGSSV